jgi:beta propeller repeat protein
MIVSFLIYPVLATEESYENNSTALNSSFSVLQEINSNSTLTSFNNSTSGDPANNNLTTFFNQTSDESNSSNTKELINNDNIIGQSDNSEPDNTNITTLKSASGTETILTPGTESSDQYNNVIYGDIVAWIDPFAGSNEVRVLDLSSGRDALVPHSLPVVRRSTPSVWQDRIVYSENKDWYNHVWIYNITTASLVPLTTNQDGSNQNQPGIFGNNIVFTDDLNPNSAIYLYQLETNQVSQITAGMNETSHYSPSVTDGYVVWTGDNGGKIELYCYLIYDGTCKVIASDTGDFYYQTPSVSGENIVWQDYRNLNFDIYLCNVTTGNETLLTPGAETTNQMFPSIWRDRVVYIDRENNSDSVIFLNLTTGERSIVAIGNPDTKANPRIWGDRIVWEDYRNNEWDIYMFTLGEARTPVISDFAVNNTSGEVPFTVQFTDKSAGNPASHQWDFGDGNVSDDINPVYTYRVPGIYTVSLTVGSSYSRDNKRIENLIMAGAPPTASFIADPISGPVPLLVTFTDTSAGYPAFWNWDFGDNTTSDEKNPSHMYYYPGEYSVTLNAGNQYGSNIARESVYVVNATRNEVPFQIPGLVAYSSETGSIVINTSQDTLFEFELTENNTILAITPKENMNAALIILESLDGYGFLQVGTTVSGNLTGMVITSQDLSSPLFDGTSGRNSFINFSVEILPYSPDSSIETVISTQIPEDEYEKFVRAVWDEQYAGGITGTAYIVRCLKNNLAETGPATITMGVGHVWLEEHSPYVDNHDRFRVRMTYENGTYIDLDTNYLYENTSLGLNYYSVSSNEPIDPAQLWALVWNSSLNLEDAHISLVSPINPDTPIVTPIILSVDSGWVANNIVNDWQNIGEPVTIIRIDDSGSSEVLATKFLYFDPVKDIDVFQGFSPHGLSKFALITVNNPGNPLQMLYLSISARVTPPAPTGNSNTGGGGGGGGSYGGSGNQATPASEPDASKGSQSGTVQEGTVSTAPSNNGQSNSLSPESVSPGQPPVNPVSPVSNAPAANPPVLPPQPTSSVFTMLMEAAAIVSVSMLVVISVYMRSRKPD